VWTLKKNQNTRSKDQHRVWGEKKCFDIYVGRQKNA